MPIAPTAPDLASPSTKIACAAIGQRFRCATWHELLFGVPRNGFPARQYFSLWTDRQRFCFLFLFACGPRLRFVGPRELTHRPRFKSVSGPRFPPPGARLNLAPERAFRGFSYLENEQDGPGTSAINRPARETERCAPRAVLRHAVILVCGTKRTAAH